MSSQRTKAASFSKSEWSNASTRRKIISNPYDSDSDISFVQPFGDKKCAVKFSSPIQNGLQNASRGVQDFGNSLALHVNQAIQTFVASDSERSDEDSDDSGRARRARAARKKAMELLLDKAGSCAASLRAVAEEVPQACMTANECLGLIRGDDESLSSSDDERPTRRMRTKKVSEAKPHDGNLYEEISVTTDAQSFSTGHRSSSESEESSNSSSDESVDSARKNRLDKLRRRRKQFLRRRATERAAGAETEDDDESSFRFGGPRLGLKRSDWKVPSQELRCKGGDFSEIIVPVEQKQTLGEASPENTHFAKSAIDMVPDLVNTSNDDSLLNTTNDDALPEGTPSLPSAPVVPDLVNPSTDLPSNNQSQVRVHSNRANSPSPTQLKWQSMEREISSLSPLPTGYTFLNESHLGLVVIQAPCEGMAEVIQLGDVIIRLNGIDVRSLDAKTVSEMIRNMAGENVRVTFLRKSMML